MIVQNTNTEHSPNQAPIGVFDSGIGGLSVFRHLQQLMPNEQYVYYADTQNVPYGNKSGDEILFLTLQAADWLCKRGCKLIVVACNSASAHALQALRERCNVPIVGLVPAVKPACQLTTTKQIAVLATQATLEGKLLAHVINEVATPYGITVQKHFEPLLVPWIESGMPINHHVADLLIKQTQLWCEQGVDVLVLGCTHYPFFREFLQAWIDEQCIAMTLIDSGAAIAQRVKSQLEMFGIANTSDGAKHASQTLTFYASQLSESVALSAKRLSNASIRFVDSDFRAVNA